MSEPDFSLEDYNDYDNRNDSPTPDPKPEQPDNSDLPFMAIAEAQEKAEEISVDEFKATQNMTTKVWSVTDDNMKLILDRPTSQSQKIEKVITLVRKISINAVISERKEIIDWAEEALEELEK